MRFFLAQSVSSLGDWIGVIAIAVFAADLAGDTGVGMVMTARVLPGFIVGPIAGVIADRWDRKRTMVVADFLRAGIIFALPFVPNLLFLLLASVALESLTLIWGPAKDASLPHFVKPSQLTHANSLSLISIYGPWPLASLVFASMTTLSTFLADKVPVLEGLANRDEALALWVDSLTFLFSAVMISTLAIPSSRRRGERLDLSQIKRDLVEGLEFIRDHPQVRPWLIGIGCTFAAAGGVFSLGIGFVDNVLHGGPRGFAFLVGFLATGMIIGLLAIGLLARKVQKDVLFSSSLFLLGLGLIALASMGSLESAIPIASALGFFGGAAYSTGYSLLQETTRDDLRGRTFSAAYTIIRIGTLIGLGLFPFVAGAFGNHTISIGFDELELPGSRVTLWLAGLVVVGGGALSMRAIKAGRTSRSRRDGGALFVAFEGGEGAGKTTQMERFVDWLKSQGREVLTTREPGGTAIGERVREILLDPQASEMDDRTEALLYAADRAQHVAEVIAPALKEGKAVVSDRFIDSSLAYQGLARGLGVEEVFDINHWASEGLLPDLVFFLNVEPRAALLRITDDKDRIENEDKEFHVRVSAAYMQLAQQFPDRFVVLDASLSPDEVHAQVIAAYDRHLAERNKIEPPPGDVGPGLPR